MSSSSFPQAYFDGDFNFNVDNPEPAEPAAEPANDLPNLLKHPCVMDLYRQNQALQNLQMKLQETQNKLTEKSFALQDKNQALQSQVVTLESELTTAKQK